MTHDHDDLLDERLRRALAPFASGDADAGDAEIAEAGARPRGRILRMRMGFNPNSSSVGTTVVVFLWTMIGASTVLAATAGLLAYRFANAGASPDEADEGGGGEGAGGEEEAAA